MLNKSIDEIIEILGSDSEMREKLNSLPYNLQISDLVLFLGLCESTVYKITKQPGFPHLDTGITKLLVPRPLFLDWYYKKCSY